MKEELLAGNEKRGARADRRGAHKTRKVPLPVRVFSFRRCIFPCPGNVEAVERVCYFWITPRGRVGRKTMAEKRREVVVGSWVSSEKMWKIWEAGEYVL